MSNHFSATIPLTETPVTVTQPESRDALDYLLTQPDARLLSEALGLVGYQGHNWNSHSKRSVPAWRKGSLR